MRIKIGDRYRDYIYTLYVVKSYKNKIITFEVDNGKEKDEVLHKSLFESELKGNRFFVDTSPQTEISDKEIVKEAIEHSKLYENKFVPRNAFIMGARWYKEQLKNKQ